MNLYQPTITGSLSVSGSVNISGSITIAGGGTISGTASIATTALTASSADNLLVRNTLTAQTLVVQTITSSVDFVTGSTRFGSLAANTHVFTGSMSVSGSLTSIEAAFASSIGINGGDFRYRPNGDVTNSPALVLKSPTAGVLSVCAEVIGDASANSNSLSLRVSNPTNGRFDALSIASTGAATFSSALSTGDTLTAAKSKGGSGVESLSLLDLKLLGASAIGDNININFLNNTINIARISGVLGGDNVAYGSLAFSTRNYFTDSMVEVMRINNRGNMLVGTTTDSGYKLDISGTTRVNGSLLTNTIRTTEGSTTANSGAYATLFTISGSKAVFQIFVQVPAGAGDAANYTVYAVVLYDGSAARIIANNGGVTDIILSGLNVQARQQSGNPQTIEWKYLRIQ